MRRPQYALGVRPPTPLPRLDGEGKLCRRIRSALMWRGLPLAQARGWTRVFASAMRGVCPWWMAKKLLPEHTPYAPVAEFIVETPEGIRMSDAGWQWARGVMFEPEIL